MNRRNWFIIPAAFAIIFLFIYFMDNSYGTKDEYIRFHVIANSDSPEDQALKLKVRDEILNKFGKELESSDSIGTARQRIKENIKDIEQTALLEIQREGSSYPVVAQLGNFDFPTKAYGDLVLEAGNYEALRVVIGEGQGENWWCVMFPPLCFVDISNGVAKDEEVLPYHANDVNEGKYMSLKMEKSLMTKLNQEVGKDKETRVEYRFKILEWWESSKGVLSKFFSFLK